MSSPEPIPQAATGEPGADEIAVLACMARGASLRAAAVELHLSDRTVSRHLKNVCDRLGVDRPIQAVVWAVRNGLI